MKNPKAWLRLYFFILITVISMQGHSIELHGSDYFPDPVAGEVELSEAFIQFIIWDSQHNKVQITHPSFNKRSTQFKPERLDIPHVDVLVDGHPLYQVSSHLGWFSGPEGARGPTAVIVDQMKSLPDNLRQYFVFQKGGQTFVRFYMHPFDTHYRPILFSYLKDKGLQYEEGSFLKGYSTASRSLIVYDPTNGFAFSLKTNTNITSQGNGKAELRPLPTRYGQAIREINDQFFKVRHQFNVLDIAWEPIMLGLPEVDQATSVRLMSALNDNSEYHLSGFVYNDRKEAERIAREAGKSYDEFWDEAFFIKGEAMAELALLGGFWCGSNHAQNFRWVLDENKQLKRKIIFLDISDGRPIEPIFKARGESAFLERWNQLNSTSLGHNKPLTNEIRFSNFFRGDFGRASKHHTRMMKKGIAVRAAQILGISRAEVEDQLRNTKAASKDNTYGWHMSLKKKTPARRFVDQWLSTQSPTKMCESLF